MRNIAQDSSLLRTQDTGLHLPTKDKGTNAGRPFSLLSSCHFSPAASLLPAQPLTTEVEPPTVAIRRHVLLLSNNLPNNVQVFYWHIQDISMKSYEIARYVLVL